MVHFVYHPGYSLDWPGHIFPGGKYRQIHDRLAKERTINPENLLTPVPATESEVELVHKKEYLDRLKRTAQEEPLLGLNEWEVPVSEEVIAAFYLATGGTILACRIALEDQGAAMNLQGGFHHAFPTRGEGFCLINDLAVAIRVMQRENRISRAAVIDCDLHQGNGTAFAFEGDDSVFTFSIHQENNYPIKQKSSLDIGLDDLTGDREYLEHLHRHIPAMIESHRPELLLYQAGADPFEEDQLGALKLTKQGLAERDRFVFQCAKDTGTPIVVTLGGGYARLEQDVVDIHCRTAQILKEVFA